MINFILKKKTIKTSCKINFKQKYQYQEGEDALVFFKLLFQ